MLCIILVAGHGTRLEDEIARDTSGKYDHLLSIPKALLPVPPTGKPILTLWWTSLRKHQLFSEVYLVTNANKYKHYERWATANDFPIENIINDGTTSRERELGAVGDLELVLRSKKVDEEVIVISG
eukprot:Ihof_evm1s233 gene=Ihof_evmTU1s233